MTGDVVTAYFSGVQAAAPAESALLLGVVRRPQDFIAEVVDRNAPVLGPPEGLLDAYKNVEQAAEADGAADPERVAWTSVNFRERYLDHLDRSGPRTVLADLREVLADGRDVWLVCWEKRATFCHRRLLAAVLEEREPAEWRELYDPPEGADEQQAGLGRWSR